MKTCMFCGNEIGRISVAYQFFIPYGDDENPLEGTGNAHVNCITEFERAQYDYENIATTFISQWETELAH